MSPTRVALILAAASFVAAPLAHAHSLIEIARFPGGTFCFPSNLSDSGAILSGDADIAGGSPRAFRRVASGPIVNLGVSPGANHSYGYGMSGDGLVVVGASGGNAYDVACRWTQDTGMQSLGSLAAGQPSFAFDASFDGAVVVGHGYAANGAQRVLRWTSATGSQAFGQLLPGTAHSVGLAVSSSGSFITGYCYNNAPNLVYPQACIWTASGTVLSLGLLPGTAESVPSTINADGSVVVGYCADTLGQNLLPFRWSAATGIQTLGLPPTATQAVASALTADGATVVGYSFQNGQPSACIWIGASPAQDLLTHFQNQGISTAGWTLSTATISADGSTFAGTGTHNGANVAWYIAAACSAPPAVNTHPQPQSVVEGNPASFSISASGIGAHYQWLFNTVPIPAAASSTYSIPVASPAHAGLYACTVSNSCGSVTSNAALLTITSNCTLPHIDNQPSGDSLCPGQPFEIAVEASALGGISYQWQLDSVDLPARTAPTLEIAHVSLATVGSYRCILTNDCGTRITENAVVEFTCPGDFNCDSVVGSQDFFDFVAAFFSNDADYNGDSFTTSQDFFDFLAAFFDGC